MLVPILFSAQVIAVHMLFFFILAQIRKNNSLVDVGWGLGFVLVALVNWYFSIRIWFHDVTAIVLSLWGLRLAIHIGKRNIGKPEDWRYAQWRKDWGKWFILRSFFQIFLLQGALILVVASPVVWIISQVSMEYQTLFFLGIILWLIGWLCEVLADHQLAQFVKTKKPGEIMTTGIWKYSRHPNYFGDATLWWGISLMALSVNPQWWLLISPLIMNYLLRYVSGVPFLEKKYADNKAFQEYAKRTSIFIPWFPKG